MVKRANPHLRRVLGLVPGIYLHSTWSSSHSLSICTNEPQKRGDIHMDSLVFLSEVWVGRWNEDWLWQHQNEANEHPNEEMPAMFTPSSPTRQLVTERSPIINLHLNAGTEIWSINMWRVKKIKQVSAAWSSK